MSLVLSMRWSIDAAELTNEMKVSAKATYKSPNERRGRGKYMRHYTNKQREREIEKREGEREQEREGERRREDKTAQTQ